jgi:4-alpha-glucanotransferase
MNFPRASGILLHPTSLPGAFGIGDLGDEAYKFADFLAEAGQTYWQILPLGQTGYGDSPYQCYSAFAGNINLISPQKLVRAGLLSEVETNQKPNFPEDRVDFGSVINWKNRVLSKAYENFRKASDFNLSEKFQSFKREFSWWLDDYTLFQAIRNNRNEKPWYEWETPLKLRDENALAETCEDLREEVEAQKFYQFLFFRQWSDLRKYANDKGLKIIGDVPIFVALNSADVWHNPSEFKLNADGSPKVVSGVPPDYFSRTGQLWGNPIYDWDKMRNDGFRWWIERVKFTLKTVDIVRIDHFRGFAACWEVPGADKTAEYGSWVDMPGKELFEALKDALGENLPFMAEDLGVITPDVEDLRDSFNLPGMRILQYAFGGDTHNSYLPHNYIQNCVAYSGTHDNDTTVGWFAAANEREREFCLKYLNSDGREIHWDFIRAIFESVADTAIIPLQDILGLGGEARMNLPASGSGNWNWRCRENDFSAELVQRLKDLTKLYGRA